MVETNGSANLNIKNGNFICGVVEGKYYYGFVVSFLDTVFCDINLHFTGFYGRPWTTEQRKDLFRK